MCINEDENGGWGWKEWWKVNEKWMNGINEWNEMNWMNDEGGWWAVVGERGEGGMVPGSLKQNLGC